ncbi:hypothetical protein MBOU_13950 [Mycobacterium bourgelatii]|uniref:Uncharacterized protein n=1 Tax=Mycobacterium bourgelatii TaxID=1273442 RepID=A0A7I9YLJ1_MYCBU|nr:hypothetical protein MBOU_13950 [Mycobacterium bourgelatii]
MGCHVRTGRVLLLDAGQHRYVLMDDQDRRRRRGLIAFQIFIYGLLIAMFAIQLQMYFTRDW